MEKVLDVCCGSRAFWFKKQDRRGVFLDKRNGTSIVKDISSPGEHREITIRPDIQADFMALPFRSGIFDLVVFDPPHLKDHGNTSWLSMRYGRLEGDWEFEIQSGFIECFRVLRSAGVLIFKWSEVNIPISKVLDLVSERPLFGHRSGKKSKTHWVSFIKPSINYRQRINNNGKD